MLNISTWPIGGVPINKGGVVFLLEFSLNVVFVASGVASPGWEKPGVLQGW
jgi:hypothetical protein